MARSFFVVPQWQGSGSSRAMHLVEGAESIGGDLPSASTVVVPVPLGAGSDQESGVRRLTTIESVRRELHQAITAASGVPIVIGGDWQMLKETPRCWKGFSPLASLQPR